MKGLIRNRKGQGMTEYILIIALIAIFVIAGVKFFGGKVKQSFRDAGNAVSDEVSGAISESDR